MNILDYAFVSIEIIAIIISMIFAIRVFLRYRDQYSIRLILLISFFNLWTISRVLLSIFPATGLIGPDNNFAVIRVGNFFLIAAILILAFIVINSFFGKLSQIFALISYSVFSGVIVMVLYDFFNPIFFKFSFVDGNFVNEVEFLAVTLIIAGLVSLAISYLTGIQSLDKLPAELYDKRPKYQLFMIPITIMVTIFFIFIISSLDFMRFTNIFTLSMNILFFYIIYYLYSQPYLQFNMGLSPEILLEKNYVGYMLGAITNIGPDVIVTSEIFNQIVGLDDVGIYSLNVGGTTALGVNESFNNKIAIIPVPNESSLSAIMYTFRIYVAGLNGNDVKMPTSAVIAVIIPSVVLVNLKNVRNAEEKVKEIIEKYTEISQLKDDTELRKVVLQLLEELTY